MLEWMEPMTRRGKQAIEYCLALGNFETLAEFVEDGIITIDQAKERAKERKEEFMLWYQERKKR